MDSTTPNAEATANTLASIRAQIERLQPAPAFVIASGDLANHGNVDAYRRLRHLMEGFPIPVIWALGNHDNRVNYWAGMHDQEDQGLVDHATIIQGVHIITLDTSRYGQIGGTLDDTQIAFLDSALSAHPDLPKIVVMHHPILVEGVDHNEWHGLDHAASARLAQILPNRGVQGVFSGHIHLDRFSTWHGVPIIVSMGLQNSSDPLYVGDGVRSLQGASMSICTLRESGLTVTTVPQPTTRQVEREITAAQLAAYVAALNAK
ncbi:hypothetical protein BVG79_01546 [Ketogulonicigenium robustum]|uniref:Calcineurin-like phosphoesterase domain-containing protein n=1 Tax=Ketogulonicigenium robustum TaxID=92947 RepID=A0A1W6P051_9RHOB|nr:hypothetical protein BVG79_01546 [Ketogulonicigenium robustum]